MQELAIERGTFAMMFLAFTAVAAWQRVTQTFGLGGTRVKARHSYVRQSFNLLFVTYLACVVFTIAEFFWVGRELDLIVSLFGLIVCLSGIALRNAAIRAMGEAWSFQIDLEKTKSIVRTGPYRYLRHPYYLAVFFELLGFALITNSYYACLLVIALQSPLLLWRIRVEERALQHRFGRVYQWYKRKLGNLPL